MNTLVPIHIKIGIDTFFIDALDTSTALTKIYAFDGTIHDGKGLVKILLISGFGDMTEIELFKEVTPTPAGLTIPATVALPNGVFSFEMQMHVPEVKNPTDTFVEESVDTLKGVYKVVDGYIVLVVQYLD